MAAGADLNKRLNSGASPLMLAIINARWELAAMLVDKGANPNDDGMGFTPLHQLVWAYHPNVVYMPPGPVPTGKLGRHGSRESAARSQSRPERPDDEEPAGRVPDLDEPHRRHAAVDGGAGAGPRVDASPARARRGSAHQDEGQHDAADRRLGLRLAGRRKPGSEAWRA